MKLIITFFIVLYSLNIVAQLPEGFVYAESIITDLQVELRYCSGNNFVGTTVDGYQGNVCIMTKQTADALAEIQKELKKENLGLKIFDAYRPQRAVNHFWRWAKNVNDTVRKQQFYPDVAKKDLFKLEYIATKSRHSSGSTVDITLVNLTTNKELDMGTPYDFFGEESWVSHTDITKEQQVNRQKLQTVMLKNGFRNYPKEWWHFTLRYEPFRNTYFDFVVE